MVSKSLKDFALDKFSIARRIYGLKLKLKGGNQDAATWFLSNSSIWDSKVPLDVNGIILDTGAFQGAFTRKMLKNYPNLQYWLFEPIPNHARNLERRFKNNKNVRIFESAVSSDGRELNFEIAGLRTRNVSKKSLGTLRVSSTSIQQVFDECSSVEMLKLNIEGMEYECLEKLIETNSLLKAKYLLIQFHNFEENNESRRNTIRSEILKGYINIYCFDWMWELWIRKESN